MSTKKSLIVGLILAVVMLFAALPGGKVEAATLEVCASGCPYTSIQAAINAALPGDTVHVAAGTYSESLGGYRDLQIFKSLSLIGDGSGTTIVELTGLQHGVEIRPDAGGTLLIEGISFTKPAAATKSSDWGVIVGETGGTFASLTFRDVEVAYAQARNLHLAAATYTNIVIDGCNIHDAGTWGFSARGVIGTMTVTDSHFDNNGWFDPAHGIGFDLDNPTSVGALSVTGGTFNNNKSKGINLVKTTNAAFTNITASNNGGAPGGGFGVSIWEWAGTSSNINFYNPTIQNNSLDGILLGSESGKTISGVTVLGGILTGNGRADVFIYREAGWGDGVIEDVTIQNAELGKTGVVMPYETVNAAPNYWGTTDAAAIAAAAGGGVKFNPWCLDAACTQLYVATGGKIQDAIDAADPGDTIFVEAGTYVEQLIIDKPLSLIGPNSGLSAGVTPEVRGDEAIIRFPSGLTGYQEMIWIDAEDVTVDGFTLDGQDLEETVEIAGIVSEEKNLTIKNNIIKNFNYVGILTTSYEYVSGSWDRTFYNTGLLIEDNLVTNELPDRFYNYSAIYVQGDNGIVRGNIADKAYRGMQIQPYGNPETTQGLVENNHVKGYKTGIWFNYSEVSAVDWLVKDNLVEGIEAPVSDPVTDWEGLLVQTFYAGDVAFTGNTVNFGTTGADNIYPFRVINWPTTSTGTVDLDATFVNNTFERVVVITDGTNIIKKQPDMAFYSLIQPAIDAATGGETILVGPGSYPEAVTLNKPNITVKSSDGAVKTLIVTPVAPLTTGVKVLANMGVVTFDGFTVTNFTESGIIQGMSASTGTTFHVLNNIVYPYADYLRNGIQVTGDGSTVIGNRVSGKYLTDDWGSTAIGVVNASNVLVQYNTVTGPGDYGISAYTWGAYEDSNIQILNNTITGFDAAVNVDAYSGGSVTNVDVHQNIITGYSTGIIARPYPGYGGVSVSDVDATLNYWGSACGPTSTEGVAVVSPWYTNEAMTATCSGVAGSFVFPTVGSTTESMNAIIACAAPGSTLTFEGGTYPGGLVVGPEKYELTFEMNGATVGAGSPAFTISGDDITINGPGKLLGDSLSAGVVVNTGADNFILDGVEITGWTDGVYVGGAVESLKIVNNWIHTNSGRGLVVGGTPTGVVTIKGNLFKANADAGVLYSGAGQLDATYNSWGSPTGPVGLDADKVLSTPFNFYEIYFDMDPDDEQAWRRVAVSETFDVALKADAVNVYGLSFKFTYEPDKVVLNLTTFDAAWLNKCTRLGEDTHPLGTLEYFCNLTSGDAEWQGGTIATFNFTALESAVESFFDIFTELPPITTEPVSPTAGAVGGVKVWVNNAGYNDPFGHGLVTDTDDGRLTIDGIAQFTGFVDLEGRPNDSGALLQVFDAASGGVLKATALSESSGKYTTVYEPDMWMVVSTVDPAYTVPYYLIFDRDLFLPTALVEKNLTQEGLTTLALLKLLGGDGTNDDYIDIADAGCIGMAYGTTNNVCGTYDPIYNPSPIPGANSDVTGDGIVNIYDLTLMGGNFYKGLSEWY